MATVTIPDDVLQQAGLTEKEVLVEVACRLFDAGKLALWPAARLAGLDRDEMEEALANRGIPVYRPQLHEVLADLEAIRRLGA